MAMLYTVLDKEDFDQQLQDAGDNLVIIDFFANWCGPCKIVNIHLQEFANQYAGKAKFLKVNVDDCEDIAMSYNINSMPTFVFIRNHQILDELVGSNADELQKYIEKHVNVSQISLEKPSDAKAEAVAAQDTEYTLEAESDDDNEIQENPTAMLEVILNEKI